MWCEACDWNVDPLAGSEKSTRRRDRLSRAVAARLSDRLFQEVVADADLRPRWDAVRVAAYALAALIHLLTVAIAAAGIFLVAGTGFRPLPLGLGVILLLVAWVLRPRLGRVPKNASRITAERAPTVHAMVGQMSELLGAHKVDLILVDHSFNASMATLGLRRRRVLTIGLQLWNVLSPEERVAILGHELAHDVNGDSTRGLVVGSALSALQEWHRLLTPSRSPRFMSRTKALEDFAGLVLMMPAAWLVRNVLRIERRLVFYGGQRAEYLADELAAGVAGTDAAIAGLEKTRIGEACWRTLERTVRFKQAPDVWAVHRECAETFPHHEAERLRRVDARRPARLELTHPATYRRVAALRSRPARRAQIVLSDTDRASMDAELAPWFRGAANAISQRLGAG